MFIYVFISVLCSIVFSLLSAVFVLFVCICVCWILDLCFKVQFHYFPFYLWGYFGYYLDGSILSSTKKDVKLLVTSRIPPEAIVKCCKETIPCFFLTLMKEDFLGFIYFLVISKSKCPDFFSSLFHPN